MKYFQMKYKNIFFHSWGGWKKVYFTLQLFEKKIHTSGKRKRREAKQAKLSKSIEISADKKTVGLFTWQILPFRKRSKINGII